MTPSGNATELTPAGDVTVSFTVLSKRPFGRLPHVSGTFENVALVLVNVFAPGKSHVYVDPAGAVEPLASKVHVANIGGFPLGFSTTAH